MNDFIIRDGVLQRYTGISENVVIPDGVTEIGWSAFQDCTSITSVKIPDSVVIIGRKAFWNCYRLQKVSLPRGIQLGKDAFPKRTKISYRTKEEQPIVTTEKPKETKLENQSQISENLIIEKEEPAMKTPEKPKETKSEKHLQISEDFIIEDDVLKLYIGNPEKFSDQNEMKLTIPEGVKFIGECAFARCLSLSSIEIPDSVVGIRDCAFALCTHLTEITLPKNICLGEQVFHECTKLTVIKIRFPGDIIGTFEKPALDAMFQKL